MCYRALTCNVEIYGYIFLSCGNERKTKISYSLVSQKGKIYKYLWDVFLMLWTPLGLGCDTSLRANIVLTSGAYLHASKAVPDRPEHGVPQGVTSSSRRKGRGADGTVGSR